MRGKKPSFVNRVGKPRKRLSGTVRRDVCLAMCVSPEPVFDDASRRSRSGTGGLREKPSRHVGARPERPIPRLMQSVCFFIHTPRISH